MLMEMQYQFLIFHVFHGFGIMVFVMMNVIKKNVIGMVVIVINYVMINVIFKLNLEMVIVHQYVTIQNVHGIILIVYQ